MAGRARAGTVLFRVAGGAGIGFGHVMRALSLARALRVPARLSLRGGPVAWRVALEGGAVLDDCRRARDLDAAGARLLVLDDPSARAARAWVAAARRLSMPSVSLHDLGLARVPSDLAVDASVGRTRGSWPAPRVLLGPEFTVLDPEIARLNRRPRMPARGQRVIVALGGGSLGRAAVHLGRELQRALPGTTVLVAPGFVAGSIAVAGVRCVAPSHFRRELAHATVAVLGGGVSLAEACALGIPAVGVAVVAGQVPTVRAFARRKLALDGGRLANQSPEAAVRVAQRVVGKVERLLEDQTMLGKMARTGRATIDGRGADRVADAIRRLTARGAGPLTG